MPWLASKYCVYTSSEDLGCHMCAPLYSSLHELRSNTEKNEQTEITTGNVSYITSIMSNIVSLMAFEIFDLQVL